MNLTSIDPKFLNENEGFHSQMSNIVPLSMMFSWPPHQHQFDTIKQRLRFTAGLSG